MCETGESQCDSMTCLNSGTCLDHGDSYLCVCPPGFGGSTCNSGELQHLGAGWYGNTNRTNTKLHAHLSSSAAMNNTCDSQPCANGATCVGGGGTFTCICKDGWEGPTCTESKTMPTYPNDLNEAVYRLAYDCCSFFFFRC